MGPHGSRGVHQSDACYPLGQSRPAIKTDAVVTAARTNPERPLPKDV
eukprot:CAMPEP_0119064738 /NCGR_PEP_ID=MMETSP1178-20130426/7734_1 /TAXON_ID=33656 /ORGANISM="unid sp, Strain CCMP2000" /LENGTH=46 /DNA_ID= /DNA_START= /DNA_END= /DNA_ORIENTATION=